MAMPDELCLVAGSDAYGGPFQGEYLNEQAAYDNWGYTGPYTCYVLKSEQSGANSIFELTPEQGASIGGAIILVWAVAFTVRAAIQALQSNERENEND